MFAFCLRFRNHLLHHRMLEERLKEEEERKKRRENNNNWNKILLFALLVYLPSGAAATRAPTALRETEKRKRLITRKESHNIITGHLIWPPHQSSPPTLPPLPTTHLHREPMEKKKTHTSVHFTFTSTSPQHPRTPLLTHERTQTHPTQSKVTIPPRSLLLWTQAGD